MLPEKSRNSGAEKKGGGAARPSSHAMWSGSLSFGLVNIPVELHSAARARRTSLKMVDAEGNALGRQYVSSKDGAPLDSADILRAHEVGEDAMVVVTDEELDQIAPDKSQDIDLRRFVPLGAVPPMFFERAYFMLPAGQSTKAYHLLASTLEEGDRMGIGTFVMRGHEYLVGVLGVGGLLRAVTLRHADELRTAADIGLPDVVAPPAARVSSLGAAIDELTESEIDPTELRDEYAERLRALAEAKAERNEGVVRDNQDGGEEEGGGRVVDLMKLLKERLSSNAQVSTADEDPGSPPGPRATSVDRELKELSKNALYEKAQELDIVGRSKMAKAELIEAIRAAS